MCGEELQRRLNYLAFVRQSSSQQRGGWYEGVHVFFHKSRGKRKSNQISVEKWREKRTRALFLASAPSRSLVGAIFSSMEKIFVCRHVDPGNNPIRRMQAD